jgi:endonuclease YncB( thermonuclease family)
MNRRQKRLASFIVAILAIGLSALGQQLGWFDNSAQQMQTANPGLYRVTRFVDGDTITVDMNGTPETVRMIGVDTPETHKPNTPVQCYGPAAAAYTKNLIGAQKVRLEADPTNQNRDRYNRLLRYVYLPDNRLVQAELVKNGYGFAYTSFPFTKKETFILLEENAKLEGKGLWANCTVTIDGDRKQTNNQ